MSERAPYNAGGDPPLLWRNRIREMREEAGMRQVDLAEAAGMQRSNLAATETGVRQPTVGTLLRLARALGVSVDELIVVEGEER